MNEFLKSILEGIYSVVGSYGWSVVVFTILVRAVLMPLDYKSRVGMRKMQSLAPKQQKLQEKYSQDPDKLQRKLGELYREEGASPMSGCWPMLLTMPILICMFTAMRMVANEQQALQAFQILAGQEPVMESWLWIKNIWMADSPFVSAWPSISNLKMVPLNEWSNAFGMLSPDLQGTLAGLGITAESFVNTDVFKATLESILTQIEAIPAYAANTQVYETLYIPILNMHIALNMNGYLILPILASGSQFLMTKLSNVQQAPAATGDQQQAAQSTGKFMNWFFPIFTLILCFSYTASFAIYWVAVNFIQMGQTKVINAILDKKEAEGTLYKKKAKSVGGGLK